MPLSSPLKFLYEIRVVGIPYTQHSTQLLTLDAVWRIVIPSELLIWAGLSFYRAFSWNLPFYRGFCSFFDDYEMTGSAVPIWNDKSQPPTWIGRRIVCLRDVLACYIIYNIFIYCILLSIVLIYLLLCPSRRCQGGIQRSLRIRKFQPTFSARSCSRLFLETPTWLVPSPPIELGARKSKWKAAWCYFVFETAFP